MPVESIIATCSIDGCDSPVAVRGWCRMHYQRFQRHGDPCFVKRIHGDHESRFWSKVDKTGDCWTWKPECTPYGRFVIGDTYVYAHRYAYELLVSPIPKDFHVLHRCDNPRCVNPAHLFVGTHADNMRDRDEKGRGAWRRKHI